MSSGSQKGTTSGGLSGFVHDISGGIRQWQVSSTFALDEIQQRYRRSYLGVLWIMVSYAMFVGGISIIFSGFTSESSTSFLIHVALSYAAFMFIIGNVTDGCDVFVRSSGWIKSVRLPYSVYVYRSVFRSLFPFALQMSVAFLAMVTIGWRPSMTSLLALPALLVFLINAVGVQYLVGLIGARYRDFTHLVASITRLLFFVTPILWTRADMDEFRRFIVDLNPLTHYLEIFSAPLMNSPPQAMSWFVVIGFTCGIWLSLLALGSLLRTRLAYWV